MYLLDTCVVSDLRRSGQIKQRGTWFQTLATEEQQAYTNLVAWFDNAIVASMSISAVTVFELEQGVLRLQRRDPTAGAVLRRWLDQMVLPQFVNSVVPFDEQSALLCAFLHVPDNKPYRDAMIGASAMARHLTLVTRNTADFVGMADTNGNVIRLCNPYSVPSAA